MVYKLCIDRRPFYIDIPEGPLTWCYKHPGRELSWTHKSWYDGTEKTVYIYAKEQTKWYSNIYVRDPAYKDDCIIARYRKHEIEGSN